jgi:hypothetical protein
MTRRGVTVLELLFGLTAVALVASIGTATFSLLAKERLSHRDSTDAVRRETTVRRTIVDWLEEAHASIGTDAGPAPGVFQLIDATDHGRDADVLVFTTTAPTPLATGETIVRLYVDVDAATPERGLTAELTSWPGGPAARLQLDSTVVAMNVRLLTLLLSGQRWVPSWMSTAVLPRGIEIRLRGKGRETISPFLRMPIVVAVEGGR